MPNRVQCVVFALLIVPCGIGCIANKAAHSQLTVFAPVSFTIKGVDFDVKVRNRGASNENEIVGLASGKSEISTVWLYARLIPDSFDCEIHKEGRCEIPSHGKSYGVVSSSSNPRREFISVLKIPEELSNIRYIDLEIGVRLNSGEDFCCSVKVFNMTALIQGVPDVFI